VSIKRHDDSAAPTQNVTLFRELTKRLLARDLGELAFGVFYGPSGYGKTVSAMSSAITYRSHYVRMGSTWSTKALADEICRKLHLKARGTSSAALNDIVDQLCSDPGRPLIIDEADFLIKRDLIDFVRDIVDNSKTPVILIGEELLPGKLRRFERAHNRVLEFVQAQPTSADEARMFAALRAPKLAFGDDLIAAIIEAGEGRARRICRNIDIAKELAKARGLDKITLKEWGNATFFDGEPPKRRAA